MFFYILWKLAKGIGFRVYCAFKCADGILVFITGINNQYFRVRNQVVPLFRLNVGANRVLRIDPVDAHSDNFFFELDLSAVEGLLVTR